MFLSGWTGRDGGELWSTGPVRPNWRPVWQSARGGRVHRDFGGPAVSATRIGEHAMAESAFLPIFANPATLPPMATMNISLPEALKDFVEAQVSLRHYSTSSEYVRKLIRRDQERMQLRDLMLEGAESAQAQAADAAYFRGLEARAARPDKG